MVMSDQNNMNTPPVNQGASPAPARKIKLSGKKNNGQQNVGATTNNVPQFTQQMYQQMQQLMQLQQSGQIQPQQLQYLQQL